MIIEIVFAIKGDQGFERREYRNNIDQPKYCYSADIQGPFRQSVFSTNHPRLCKTGKLGQVSDSRMCNNTFNT